MDGEYQLDIVVDYRKAVTEMGTGAIAFLDSRLEFVQLVLWNFFLPSMEFSSKILVEYTWKLYFIVIAESYSPWLFTADATLPENIVNAKPNIGGR